MTRPARAVAVVVCAALSYGFVLHVADLAVRGLRGAYAGMPLWLAVYYTSLTVLDPLAAVLLALRTRAGIVLAALVAGTDALLNAYANLVLVPPDQATTGLVGAGVVGALAVATVLAAPWLWPRPAGR